jgi:hypothetical protein
MAHGLPRIFRLVEQAMPGRLQNAYAHSSGGGKLLAILQFKKTVSSDEGRILRAETRDAVDEDVDIFKFERNPLGHDHALPRKPEYHFHTWCDRPRAGSFPVSGCLRHSEAACRQKEPRLR